MIESEVEDEQKNLNGIINLIFGNEPTCERDEFDELLVGKGLKWVFDSGLIRERTKHFSSPFNL